MTDNYSGIQILRKQKSKQDYNREKRGVENIVNLHALTKCPGNGRRPVQEHRIAVLSMTVERLERPQQVRRLSHSPDHSPQPLIPRRR